MDQSLALNYALVRNDVKLRFKVRNMTLNYTYVLSYEKMKQNLRNDCKLKYISFETSEKDYKLIGVVDKVS